MYVPCWNCGTEAWIETQVECRNCRSVVRRCMDCINFTGTNECAIYKVEVTETDRQTPTTLSLSYKCPHYKVTGQALTRLQEAVAGADAAPSSKTEASADESVVAQARAVATEESLPDQPGPAPEPPPITQPKRAIVIGHRGSSALAPENTLAAIDAGLKAGATAIELDVQITRDGQAVCIHNASLPRTTSGVGWVADHDLDELQQLDAGSWFNGDFAKERIPTLDQALHAIPAPTWVNIHLRAHENSSDRCEKAVVNAIEKADCASRTWVTHHTRHGLHRIRKMLPKLRLCWISRGGESDVEYVDDAFYMGFRILQPTIHLVTAEFMDYARANNMWVNVSFARTREDVSRLLDLKVSGIFAGNPAMVHSIMNEREGGG